MKLRLGGKYTQIGGRTVALTMLQALIPPALLRGICLFCELPLSKVPGMATSDNPLHRRFCRTLLALHGLTWLASLAMPDVSRSVKMWRMFLPIYMKCKWTKLKYQKTNGYSWKEIDAAWQRRHEWAGEKVHAMLLTLSGYYVKSAQILASKGDFMPEPWTRRLVRMFDSMPPKPWAEVQKAVDESLADSPAGQYHALQGISLNLSTTFESWEPECMASASIAQVHGAVLTSGTMAWLGWRWRLGPDVVLKVQHRDMRALMDSDVRNLGRLCAFVKDSLPFDPFPMLAEMRETVPKEFDFVREARLQSAVGARLQAGQVAGVCVPKPLLALTTPQVLVMQRMHGRSFQSMLAHAPTDMATHQVLHVALLRLFEAFGHMLLEGGLFHADPHAGNLLVQDDGTLVLLDWGQCKALSLERHVALCHLIRALDVGNADSIVAAMSAMGLSFKARDGGMADPQVVKVVACIMFDTRALPEARINPLNDEALIKSIPLQNFPRDLFTIGRAIMILRGLCHATGADVKAASIWRKYAERALANPWLHKRAVENALLDGDLDP